MDTPILDSTVVDNGASPTPGDSQVAPTIPQGTDTQQVQSIVQQVEPNANPTSTEPQPGSSEYETARQLKNLAKQMRFLQQAFERSSQQNAPPASPQSQTKKQFTRDDLVNGDPVAIINQMIEERINGVKEEIPKTFEQFSRQAAHERAMQEGLRIINTNENVKSDPQGEERMKDILMEEDEDGNSLEKYSIQNPRHAAKLALDIYKQRYGSGQRRAITPSKAQMVSTATAVTPGRGIPQSTQDEAAKWLKEYNNDPNLINDPAFMARLNVINKKARQEAAQGV